MPIAEDSAGGSPVPIPTNLTTNLTGEATGSGTLDYTTGDIDIAVTVVDNGHNHILENITDVQVNNAISGQILVYNGTVWANATNTSGITAIVQDLTPQLGGNLDLNGKNINGNGNINLADNYKLTLGTGNDLELSHDGVSSYIRDVGAGDLQIFASDDVYIRGQGTNTYMARFNEGGAVTLYHNNVIRLITTDSGITVTDEVEAAEFIGPLRGPTKFKGQAGEALSAGDPVYISGISGNTTVVSKADANDASKMPAFGIIDASVSANASCQVLTFGEMHNLDTSAFSEGDELYVSNTGTLTTAIPSGESSQIQKIAKVTRSHASAGGIFIMGAGRSNAVPNLDNGDIFIGDGTNHATTTSLNTAVNALTLTNYLPLSGGAMTGNITTSGTFDGRDVSVDGAKLDGIATGADVTLNEISAGTNVTISAGGVISSTASGGLAHVVDDLTPQLGGNLDLNSNDITGTGNLNFTGSVTLSGTVDGRDVAADGTKLDGIEASADVTDTANVTAAGALMDSEVTNLAQVKAFDSSDYATAAQGTTADAALPTTGGTMTGDILFNDGVKAKYGTSSDLQIYHDGSNSYITDSGTGILFLRTNQLQIQSDDGLETYGVFTDNGAVNLYHNGSEKFATTSSGIDVTGAIDVATSGASNTSKGLAIATSGTNFESDGGIISIDHAASGAVTGGYFSKYSAGGTLRHSIKGDGKGYFAGGLDVTGSIDVSGGISINSFAPTLTFNDLSATSDYEIAVDQAKMQIKAGTATKLEINTSGIDVTGTVVADKMFVEGTAGSRQWEAGSAGQKLAIYAYDNSTFYHRLETGNATNYQWGTYDNIPIYTITNNSVKTTLLGNGNFGIGHTSPVAKMAILGSSNSTITEANSNLCVEGTGGNGMLFGTLSTTGFKSYIQSGFVSNLGTATYDLLLNPEGGNVGVGLSAPTEKLEVAGKIKVTSTDPEIFLTDTSTGVDHSIDGNSGVGNLNIHVDKNNEGSDPKFVINVGASSGLFCIEENGDTGIGLNNPANRLHIFDNNSDINMNSSANGQMHIDGNGYGFGIALNAQGANIYTNVGTRDIIFGTNETERMRVTDDGTICTRSGVAEATMISFENGNGQVGKITSSGLGTVYGTTSDYRLKTDAQPMTSSIDRLKALNPINFEWISDGSRVDGFLAHEVQSIVPEAVTGTQDAMKNVVNVVTPAVNATYDEEGNQLTPEIPEVTETTQIPDYQSIDQGKIVPLLTSALQDAIAKIEALETRLEALES